jgi:polysaccharide biosynthesis transport protein
MEIRQYLNLIRRWAWLMLVVVVLGVIAGWVYSRYQTPVYRSSTTILIMQAPEDRLPNFFYVNDKQLAQTFTQLLVTQPVVQTTSQRLGYPVSSRQVTAEAVPGAELIQVTVEDNSPERAAEIANTMVNVFLEQNQSIQASRFTSAEESLQAQIQQVEEQIATLQAQLVQQTEDSYREQVDEISRTIANLQNEINTLQEDIVRLDYIVNPPETRLGRFPFAPTPSVEQSLELVQKQDRLSELRSLLGMYQRIYVDLSYNANNGSQPNTNRNSEQIQAALNQYQQIYSNLLTNYESIRLARMRSTPNIVQVEQAMPAQ